MNAKTKKYMVAIVCMGAGLAALIVFVNFESARAKAEREESIRKMMQIFDQATNPWVFQNNNTSAPKMLDATNLNLK